MPSHLGDYMSPGMSLIYAVITKQMDKWRDLNETNHFEYLSVDGRFILKWIVLTQTGRWSSFLRLWRGTRGRFKNMVMKFWVSSYTGNFLTS